MALRGTQLWEATGNGTWSEASGWCWKLQCRVTGLEEGRTPDRVWDKEGPEQGAEKTSSEDTRNKRKASQGTMPNTMERSSSDEPETAH